MQHTGLSRSLLLLALVPAVAALLLGNATLLLIGGALLVALLRAREPVPEGGSVDVTLEETRVRRGDRFTARVDATLEPGTALGLAHQPLPETFALDEGSNVHLFDAGTTRQERFDVACPRRGHYPLEAPTLSAVHPLGLAPELVLAHGEPAEVTVEPTAVPLRSEPRLRGPGQRQPGAARTTYGPASTEFEELRDYQRGDPLKHVNWKATARESTRNLDLIVNEYEPEARANVWFFLDLHESLEVGTSVDTTLESAIEIALALVHQVTGRGHRVGGATYNGDRKATFYPDSGSRQRLVVAQELATVTPGRGHEGLPSAVERVKGFLARERPVCFVITRPEVHTESLAAGVRRIHKHTASQRGATPVTVLAPEPPVERPSDRIAREIAARTAATALGDEAGSMLRVHRIDEGARGLERAFARGVLSR